MERAGIPDPGVDPTAQDPGWLEAAADILGAGFLTGPTPETAGLDEAIGGLEALARLKNWAEAQTVRFTERVRTLTAERLQERGMQAGSLADALAASEVACALRIPERTAGTLIEHAFVLTGHLPATLTALESGAISWRHAATLVQECAGLPGFALPYFEQQLLPVAQDTTAAKLAYRARRLRAQMHPETISDRTQSARKNRRVDFHPDDDGMAWLNVYLPADKAVAIDGRLTRLSRALQCPEETRTLAQLRTDALTDLLTHTCPSPANTGPANTGTASLPADAGVGAAGAGAVPGRPVGPYGWNGIQAQVHVTVPVLTLLDVDDAPGELEGYGPIDP
ncbi:DUF222 domain-containing protein, partial [Arthrobacter sp. MSA 4-2]|uniref:DUF222 domain-containing protein n=1 Tax=Arthrobacter sp. MSA 4-2 TaxID=2794349 RepID=UPI0018E72B66